MADDVPKQDESRTTNDDILSELRVVHHQLSDHAQKIELLQNEDGAIKRHLRQLDIAVQDIRTDIEGLMEQSERTEHAVAALQETQADQHMVVVTQLAQLSEEVRESLTTALKSTPKTIKMVVSILSLIAAFMLVVATVGHPL